GVCERGPAALVVASGERPRTVAVTGLEGPAPLREALAGGAAPGPDARRSAPQALEPGLRLLARVGRCDPGSLAAFEASGGYQGLRRALSIGPEAVRREVTESRLVGRGGAAFSTGRKWAAVAAAKARP